MTIVFRGQVLFSAHDVANLRQTGLPLFDADPEIAEHGRRQAARGLAQQDICGLDIAVYPPGM